MPPRFGGDAQASINTGNTMRDEHMHGADFLDVANLPQMVFQSTSITEGGLGLHPGGQPHHQAD